MAAKSIIVMCVSACFFKTSFAQYLGAINGIANTARAAEEFAYGAALGPHGAPFSYAAGAGCAGPVGYGLAVPVSGGGFPVTSSSSIVPTGISVISENTIEGPLTVVGQLPFLGAIAIEGALTSKGVGIINYGCGNGAIGIVSEGPTAVGPAAYPAGAGYGAATVGYPGQAGPWACNGRVY